MPAGKDDHWRRLAAELGLDVEPEAPPEPPAPEPKPAKDEPKTVHFNIPLEEPAPELESEEMHEPEGHSELPDSVASDVYADAPPAESEISEEPGDVEPAEQTESADERPRRRRRRSRRKRGEPEAATQPAAENASDTDIEESPVEIVRDWNIPSWDELIASLYRPER